MTSSSHYWRTLASYDREHPAVNEVTACDDVAATEPRDLRPDRDDKSPCERKRSADPIDVFPMGRPDLPRSAVGCGLAEQIAKGYGDVVAQPFVADAHKSRSLIVDFELA
jgi:hypothetical protein